ncbi:ubiquitin-conjugating enzyme E2 T-like [Homalodisca vitripennis]|uniref:ubiquitin-conjugating enzyme E2 T-like n=1 Tax=Homalodisca vitripennis TaxID=197043 RepID=UPI001EEC72BD|nr:ubiquitin-conjugating enzyme E2 T-like [Homalodisca vitripennis]
MSGITARLRREILTLKENPPSGISCYPKEDSQTNVLTASIVGTVGSPFEKGVFQLEVIVTERYPFEPPRVRFVTPIYHPNVDAAGRICLDLLKMPPGGSWKPIYTIEGLLTAIQYLMTHPNPDDPLMPEIASQYKYNKEQYDKDAQESTIKHACTNSVTASLDVAPLQKSNNLNKKRKSEEGLSEESDSNKRHHVD